MRVSMRKWLVLAGTGLCLNSGLNAAVTHAAEMKFSNECTPGKNLLIGAVGDVLLHAPLQNQGARDPKGFRSLWRGVEALLEKPDLLYGNLEGPTSSASEPSSYPQFNYDPALLEDLKKTGFDVVSTANNHAMDQGVSGVNSTVRHLDESGLKFSGTRASANMSRPWGTVTEHDGIRIGWVACTFGTNGIPDPQHHVLLCFEQKAQVIAEIARLKNKEHADAVIVTPHWGQEYQREPLASQVTLGKQLLEAGAIAVLGSHPHMMQPIQKFTINGEERVLLYSFGNFVSAQFFSARKMPSKKDRVSTRTSVVLYLGLTKTEAGKVVINGMRYVPTYMTSGGGKVNLVPTESADFADRALSLQVVHELFPAENQISYKATEITTHAACD